MQFIRLVCSTLFMLSTLPAFAIPYSITKIADTQTTIPDGVGTFVSFGTPAIDGQAIAFLGNGQSRQSGIYLQQGSIQTVANLNGPYDNPSLSGTNVAFSSNGGVTGVIAGSPIAITVGSTILPNGAGTFAQAQSPSISGNQIAFLGGNSSLGSNSLSGIWTVSPTPTLVAGISTPVPAGQGNFTAFGRPSISSSGVAFRAFGSNDQLGIYSTIGGGLHEVASIASLGGNPNLGASFGDPLANGGNIVFSYFHYDGVNQHNDLYLANQNGLTKLLSASSTFRFNTYAFDGHKYLIDGVSIDQQGNGVEGLYILENGVLTKLLDTNTLLNGHASQSFDVGPESISGDSIAFTAYAPGTSSPYAVYRLDLQAPVPEAETYAMMLAGLGLLGFMARRKANLSFHSANFQKRGG